MKQLILIIACLICGLSTFAKEDPEEYRVLVFKTDGTVFEGYNETKFTNYFRPKVTKVSISREFKGETEKFTGEEVKRVVFNCTMNDSMPVIFDAVKAQSKMPNYFSKNPKPYKETIFLRLVYDGVNIKGYAMPIMDSTYTPSMTVVHYTWRYFYLTKDGEYAKVYWDDTDGIIPSMKKVMKFYLREFPALVEMIDNEELTPTMFRDNPAIVYPIMDRTYKSK